MPPTAGASSSPPGSPWRRGPPGDLGGLPFGPARRAAALALVLGACTFYRTPTPAPSLTLGEAPLLAARVALDLRVEPGEGRVHFALRNRGEAPARLVWAESRFLYPDGTREAARRDEWGRWLRDGLRPDTVVPPGQEARGTIAPAGGRGTLALDLGPARGGGVSHPQLVIPYQRAFPFPPHTIRLVLVMEIDGTLHEFEVPLRR
jgi:hypothetical protein